jgi:hypothetical protein
MQAFRHPDAYPKQNSSDSGEDLCPESDHLTASGADSPDTKKD